MICHKTRALALLLSLTSISLAVATGALAAEGAKVAEQCNVCHGRNGASSEPSIPTIGGFSAKYILESIKNFKNKARTCAEVTVPAGPKKGSKSGMCKGLADLSAADAQAGAQHFASPEILRVKQAIDATQAKQGNNRD